jgi:hypothetical protein
MSSSSSRLYGSGGGIETTGAGVTATDGRLGATAADAAAGAVTGTG